MATAVLYVEQCAARSVKANSSVVAALQKFETPDAVTELDLSANYVGPGGFVPLLEIVRRAPALRHLNVADNRITNEVLDALLIALLEAGHGSCGLETLNLSANPISHAGGKALIHFVRSLRRASCPLITVEGTLLTPALAASVAEACAAARLNDKFRDDPAMQAAVTKKPKELLRAVAAADKFNDAVVDLPADVAAAGGERQVGETEDGEAIMGRDRGAGAVLDFGAFGDGGASRPDASNDDAPAVCPSSADRPCATPGREGNDQESAHRDAELVPNCFVFVPNSQLKSNWRSVTTVQRKAFVPSSDSTECKTMAGHDHFARPAGSPFPAMPVSWLPSGERARALASDSTTQYWVPSDLQVTGGDLGNLFF